MEFERSPNRHEDVVADAVGSVDAVLGDEVPDLDEVDFRFWMKREFVHPRARRSPLLRCRRSSTSSPLIGFTWYSLTDQMDWDTALREDAHRVNTVGLYDLKRNIRKVGENYRRLIREWREILPAGSSALMLV